MPTSIQTAQTKKSKLKIAVLASGGGTNFQSIIDRCISGDIDAEISLLLTNIPNCGAIARAEKANVPITLINHKDFTDRESFDQAMVDSLNSAGVELVVLAGFMRLLSPLFVEAFAGRIMNIHPSLLPSFAGLHVQQKAIDYGAKFSGCTVHFVDQGMDTGPIIIQAVVPILEEDTESDLAARILKEEHRIYPEAIQLFAEGRLSIDGRHVRVAPDSNIQDGNASLQNPPVRF